MRFLFSAVLAAPLVALDPAIAAAQWSNRPASVTPSMRGLSVLSKDTVWASGTGGTFLWTTDAGTTWTTGKVSGAETFDFRDIHAVSVDTVYLMAAGQDTARIYKTTDRGKTWTLQYNDTRKGVFLDAFAFINSKVGIALGDPIDGRFMILRTEDGGATWTQISPTGLPQSLPGEAAFAASGTSLVIHGSKHAWFATGGAQTSRIFASQDAGKTWAVHEVPVTANTSSRGIFSITFWSSTEGIAVGGDYAKPDSTATTVATTKDGGKTWTPSPPSTATLYLSGVTTVKTPTSLHLIGVGTRGTALSTDNGRTWTQLDKLSLNTVVSAPNTQFLWAVGDRGKIVSRPSTDP